MAAWLIISLVIIAVLELNALGVFGTKAGQVNLWPYENHRNAIISAFVLWAIFWLLSELHPQGLTCRHPTTSSATMPAASWPGMSQIIV